MTLTSDIYVYKWDFYLTSSRHMKHLVRCIVISFYTILIFFIHGYRFDVLLDAVIILCFMSGPDFIFYITSLLYVGDVFSVAG